jgi:hypothetical protein
MTLGEVLHDPAIFGLGLRFGKRGDIVNQPDRAIRRVCRLPAEVEGP